MQASREEQAPWPSDDELADHYSDHHWDMNARTVQEYDASARATIRDGTRFTYDDPKTSRLRIGYYDPETGLLTALLGDGSEILTHFAPDDGEDYVRDLPHSTYPRW
jgi:pyocin large subunit-like protein